MIQKKIQTQSKDEIQIYVFGKQETKPLEGIAKENVNDAIQNLVSEKLNIPRNKVFLLNQTHSDIFFNTQNLNMPQEGDALYTINPGEALIVKTADCMPIFFWSETEKLIGIIHSGWKGTELGISEKLFTHLQQNGFALNQINCFIGPCARKRNYEVSQDLFDKFSSYLPEAIEPKANGKYLLGIDIVLKRRFIEKNIPIAIHDTNICTMEDKDYFSHRRGEVGRNINVIYRNG